MKEYIRETKEEKGTFEFWCPGCGNHHFVKPSIWNINIETNIISPSILVRCPDPDKPGTFMSVCHSFVRNGKIEYLNDCTHVLKGQTFEMEAFK